MSGLRIRHWTRTPYPRRRATPPDTRAAPSKPLVPAFIVVREFGDHLGTTRSAPGRTSRMSVHGPLTRRDEADQRQHWPAVLGVKRSPVSAGGKAQVLQLVALRGSITSSAAPKRSFSISRS